MTEELEFGRQEPSPSRGQQVCEPNTALRNCPFCLGNAHLRERYPVEFGATRFQIQCGECYCGTSDRFEIRASAIAAWNARAIAFPGRDKLASLIASKVYAGANGVLHGTLDAVDAVLSAALLTDAGPLASDGEGRGERSEPGRPNTLSSPAQGSGTEVEGLTADEIGDFSQRLIEMACFYERRAEAPLACRTLRDAFAIIQRLANPPGSPAETQLEGLRAEVERLTEFNAQLSADHKALNLTESKARLRAEAAEAEVTRLSGERDQLRAYYIDEAQALRAAEARLSKQEAWMGAMREALEPFSHQCNIVKDANFYGVFGDANCVSYGTTIGAVKRAAQALSDHPPRGLEVARQDLAPGIEPEQASERGEGG